MAASFDVVGLWMQVGKSVSYVVASDLKSLGEQSREEGRWQCHPLADTAAPVDKDYTTSNHACTYELHFS